MTCRQRLISFLKDGEGCLKPSYVIMDQIQKMENIRNEVSELQAKIELGHSFNKDTLYVHKLENHLKDLNDNLNETRIRKEDDIQKFNDLQKNMLLTLKKQEEEHDKKLIEMFRTQD